MNLRPCNIVAVVMAIFMTGVQLVAQEQREHAPIFTSLQAKGAATTDMEGTDEYLFRVQIPHVAFIDLTCYSIDSMIYVPFQQLFSFLRIKNERSTSGEFITGFFRTSQNLYTLNTLKNSISLGDTVYTLSPKDMFIRDRTVYVSLMMLSRLFNMLFDVRFESLTIMITPSDHLPIIRILKRERIRKQKPGEVIGQKIDVDIPREYHLVDGAMLNWGLGYANSRNSQLGTYNMNFGSELLGGDLRVSVNGSTNSNIAWQNIPWRWRFVKDEYPYFRQLTLGDYQPLFGTAYSGKGLTFGNKTLFSRRTFITSHYEGSTNPGWDVELYIRGALSGYATADSTGKFFFDIPLPYGSIVITLMYFGPNGEEQSEIRRIDVPYTSLPPREVEYTVSAGELTQFPGPRHYQFLANYGLSSDITLGVGCQYFKIGDDAPFSPAASLVARLPFNITFNGEHIQNIHSSVEFDYTSPRETRVGISFARYYPHTTNPMNMQWQGRAMFGSPLRLFSGSTYFNVGGSYATSSDLTTTSIFGAVNQTISRLTVSYSYLGQQTKTSTYAPMFGSQSSLSMWTSIFSRYLVTGRIAYDHIEREFIDAQINCSTMIFGRMQLSAMALWRFGTKSSTYQIGLQIPLDFAQTSVSTIRYANEVQFQSNAAGTLGFDWRNREFLYERNSWVGTSAVSIVPFLDNNGNAVPDRNEPLLESEVQVVVDRGYNSRFTGIEDYTRVVMIEQYSPITVQIEPTSLKDPVWIPRYKNFLVNTDPNQFKPVYIPIYYASQASGSVMLASPIGFEGVRDMKVHLKGLNNQYNDFTLTFSDGTFDYFGLPPGRYIAYLDEDQLKRTSTVSYPTSFYFELKSRPEGDVMGRINFILKTSLVPLLATRQDTLTNEEPTIADANRPRPQPVITLPDTTSMRMQEIELTKIQAPISLIDTTATNRSIIIPDTAFVSVSSIIDANKLRPSFALIDSIHILTPVPTVVVEEVPPEVGSVTAPVMPQTQSIPIILNLKSLDTNATGVLDRIAATVRKRTNYIIRIEGHSDNFGTFAENQTRSQQRADRAVNYLVTTKKVPRKNIQVQAFGSRRPIAPNTTPAGRAKNNRVDITVILK